MIAENNMTNIASVEEYTLFSLDRSGEGLRAMTEEARNSARALLGDTAGFDQVKGLTQKLHDFNMFEMNMCALFQMDRSRCADSRGSLDTAMRTYRAALEDLGEKISEQDTVEAGRIMEQDIGDSLTRIRELLPRLRDLIEREYLRPEPAQP